MQQQRKKYLAGSAQRLSGGFLLIVCAGFALFFSACGSMTLHFDEEAKAAKPASPTRFSFVFIIHGDGDYIYHDSQGQAHRADARTLHAARLVAQRRTDAEVFIFHQRPSAKLLYVIPLPDGDFLHYRNGVLQARRPYWRSSGTARFEAETALYAEYRTATDAKRTKFFLYFGHEIPEFDGKGYDASTPERAFNVRDLSAGVKSFTGDSTRFDMLVLSTCYGGTPHTIAALAPYSRTIVASPGNLHLSYFDLRAFGRLHLLSERNSVQGFARYFARQAFERLSKKVQTAVTVAVYESDRARIYLGEADSRYTQRLASLKDHGPAAVEYVDCAEEKKFVLPGMSDGVSVLFRPSRFGRAKNKFRHSGWQCCRPLAQ
ncbi:MAG: hypothetical protein RRA94_04360 [Bacteroidota bacterium]|nr:hypothetical protein [Bacteroidota bacterium]